MTRSLQYLVIAITWTMGFAVNDRDSTETFVYTTGYSKSMALFTLNGSELRLEENLLLGENMTFVQYDSELNTVYAVHEVSETSGLGNVGAISSWKFQHADGENPNFLKIQEVSSYGQAPCYISVDRETGYLHVANYFDNYTSYKIDKTSGSIQGLAFTKRFGAGSNFYPDRQADAHPHGAFPYKNFVYVTDLGGDKIHHFQITDNGIVEGNPSSTHSGDGYGPRHVAVDHQRDILYVIHELKTVIVSYKVNPENGGLEKLQEIDILEHSPIPESEHKWPFHYPAEIYIHPNGQLLYVTNRSYGALVVFSISEEGNLTFVQFQPVVGTIPRHFKIHPDGSRLIVALQDKNLLELFSIEDGTGKLTKISETAAENVPTIVEYLM